MALKLFRSSAANAVAGYIPHWYGVYREGGKVKTVSLGVPLRGRPPESGYLGDPGDRDFERSRKRAEEELNRRIAEVKERQVRIRAASKEKGDAIRETREIIERKTGRKFEDPLLTSLADLYLFNLGDRSGCHVAMIRSCFANFAAFAANPNSDAEEGTESKVPKAMTLLEVTPELATAFFRKVATGFAFSTVKRWGNLLTGAFDRIAPIGMHNPFRGARIAAVGRSATRRTAAGEKVKVETVIHHRPIDRLQLRQLYATAKSDPLLYALTVTAASTGLRIGDCCTLQWKDIDLASKEPIIMVETTAKTGAKVAVPIFDYRPGSDFEPDLGEFRRVLELALTESAKGAKYVFPEAAKLYLKVKKSKDGREYYPGRDLIYSKGKELFARALFADEADVVPPKDKMPVKRSDKEILDLIASAKNWSEDRKRRVSEVFTLHQRGESYLDIQTATGYAKSTISTDLTAVESLTGVRVKAREAKRNPVRDLLKHTRQERAAGKRGASIYSWHSLRGSFVVMMKDNGVPLDTIRLLVGHATTDMTLEYYNPTQKIAAESARRILTHRNRQFDKLSALRAALAALTPKERAQLLE